MKEAEQELTKFINEERSFIHDISNYIVIAQGMTEFVHGQLLKEKGAESLAVIRLGKSVKSIAKIVDLIRSRRDTIKQQR